MQTLAILYQAKLPPIQNGIQKPMKPGGYSDSGADIAFELEKKGISIVTPISNPNIKTDLDWVFPDTKKGIQNALNKGANTFWLNTVLYKKHEVENFFDRDLKFVGQIPSQVGIYDDKYATNEFLRKNDIPIPKTKLISVENLTDYILDIDYPLVVKPIRGRGSQGVLLVENKKELDDKLKTVFANKIYGNKVYVEEFLSGQEIAVTVMPSGNYLIDNQERVYKKPWCLPAVKRFNHKNGIAPYNGIIAVMKNSLVLENDELNTKKIIEVYRNCEKAGELLKIKVPIRIDCRANDNGNYFLFDLNMKPNMTGPSRPHRQNQDSLSLLASKKIGWDYIDLLKNIVKQAWKANY
ncbi:ATP-grasp domain-containing protein [Polaribacter porphyrae]|uniref:Carboxylate--amine ligase n=1 Tax=Polaribacter porphyrae TaxID=1137780 RepID=A0A2S7WM15_9FLAO|nr:ATP-grasp domain-containing protein [Polaribacter porphyrae]PQJ78609.1 carboxylate--amine ligase [Polaribacter porphyrae]